MEYLKIVLRSDLCVGNGESFGNSVDTDVCMDEAGLPYIPARRLKGCLKQSAYELKQMGYPEIEEKIRLLFGDAYGNEGCIFIRDAVVEGAEALRNFLTKKIPVNDRGTEKIEREIPAEVKRAAHPANVQWLFSSVRGQTRLEEGVKVDNTLRFTRVISHYDPFEFQGSKEMEFYAPFYLDSKDKGMKKFLKDCCKTTRHIGTSRNRGLGNVKISVWSDEKKSSRSEENSAVNNSVEVLKKEEEWKISYHVKLDAPITLPGCDEMNTSIPARSVLGCMAGSYLRTGDAESADFESLFLNGDVRWSALTPVINGMISDPAPMMLVKLKNDNGRMINHLAEKSTDWKGLKPKTMDGAFASLCMPSGETNPIYTVAEPSIHTIYHYSVNGTAKGGERTLYMQDSIDAGMIYGGTVICRKGLRDEVVKCLQTADLRFGRSRSAQYAACSFKKIVSEEPYEVKKTAVKPGDIIYVILKSDLAVMKEGRYITDADKIRNVLADELGVSVDIPDGQQDYCRYHTIGGYQAIWQLQKPHIPVVRAGSIYCFFASEGSVPAVIQVGELKQEGLGICYILTKEEMQSAGQVIKGSIDHVEPEGNKAQIHKVYNRLLISAGLGAMQEYALGYEPKDKDIPVGRLRLMLSEANDYKDLLKMIGTMKESDTSSEKETSRKKISEELVKTIYSEKETAGISLKKILGAKCDHKNSDEAETELWEEIEQCTEAKEVLLKNYWKVPLGIILHKQHYGKER